MNKITQAKNKKTNNLVFGIFALLLACSQMTQAQTLPFYDGLDYPVLSPTKLPGNGLWDIPGTGSGANNDAAISTGSLNSPAGVNLATSTGNKVTIAGSGDDSTRIFTQQSADGTTVYYSCLINITDIGTASTGLTPIGSGSYSRTGVVGFTNLVNETSQGTGNIIGVLMVRKDATDPTKYNVGIAKKYDKVFIWDTTQYDINTTLFVVVSYQFIAGTTNDICKLWVNPTCGTTEPTETVLANTTDADAADLNYFQIRQEGSSSPGAQVDEVRVGLTWADVTPAGTLGINQNEITGLSVYPNPATNGNLYITSNSNSEKSVVIFDLLGKEVLKASTTNNAVNISTLKSGVYVVKITEDGKTDTRKLIME
ncbi:MAG: T9SS type A sorting domain-containing protein [Bacteroidota bacterium]